jgi:TRAP transporter TAXI family solute receptor
MQKRTKVDLTFRGYYGHANYIKFLGVICYNICRRLDLVDSMSRRETRLQVQMGTCHKDNVEALEHDEIPVSATNTVTVSMAVNGAGLYDKKQEYIRALGCIPHDDRLTLVVKKDTGVASFEDIKNKKVPLRLVTNFNDGIDTVGYVVEEVFKAYGFTSDDIERWGGKILRVPGPGEAFRMMLDGTANAIFHEASMEPPWYDIFEKYDVNLLRYRDDVLDKLHKSCGTVAKYMPDSMKRWRNVGEDARFLSWSDWTLIAKPTFPDDLAYLITQIMCEDMAMLDQQYKHIPHYNSALDYPVTPEKVFRVKTDWNFPLHPGSEKYFREKHLL